MTCMQAALPLNSTWHVGCLGGADLHFGFKFVCAPPLPPEEKCVLRVARHGMWKEKDALPPWGQKLITKREVGGARLVSARWSIINPTLACLTGPARREPIEWREQQCS